MHRVLIAAISLIFVWGSSTSYAGHYKHRGYYGGGYYGGGHYRGYHHRHHKYRRHRHSNDDAAWLLGGLVLGSVITHAYQNHHSRHYSRPHTVRYYRSYPAEREIVYRTRPPIRTSITNHLGRHFYRDLAGNCFEITSNDQGDQLRQELPAEECNW